MRAAAASRAAVVYTPYLPLYLGGSAVASSLRNCTFIYPINSHDTETRMGRGMCIVGSIVPWRGTEDGQATVICGWALSGVELVLPRPLSTHPLPPTPTISHLAYLPSSGCPSGGGREGGGYGGMAPDCYHRCASSSLEPHALQPPTHTKLKTIHQHTLQTQR